MASVTASMCAAASQLVAGKVARSPVAARVGAPKAFAGTALRAVQNGATTVMDASSRPLYRPGADAPEWLDGSLPGDYGFDPLGLGSSPEALRWNQQAELVHARWAMLAVAGILVQEIVRPDVFWYEAATKVDLPFNIMGLVAFQLFTMHWVEARRGQDIFNPNSVNDDPIFGYKIPDHEPGYPGGIFAPFIPGNLDDLKVKEIKNGRLAMVAFIGFVMAAQVTGLNPLAALRQHLADPTHTTSLSRATRLPGLGQVVSEKSGRALECKIAPYQNFQGAVIPTPCAFPGLWP